MRINSVSLNEKSDSSKQNKAQSFGALYVQKNISNNMISIAIDSKTNLEKDIKDGSVIFIIGKKILNLGEFASAWNLTQIVKKHGPNIFTALGNLVTDFSQKNLVRRTLETLFKYDQTMSAALNKLLTEKVKIMNKGTKTLKEIREVKYTIAELVNETGLADLNSVIKKGFMYYHKKDGALKIAFNPIEEVKVRVNSQENVPFTREELALKGVPQPVEPFSEPSKSFNKKKR